MPAPTTARTPTTARATGPAAVERPLAGTVALVAGGTRGAGRGIAVELGAAGATVYVTGRTTRDRRSEMDRPETIEETAERVTAAGGEGVAVRVDHLVPAEVEALVRRVDDERGRLDVLVNDVWGARTSASPRRSGGRGRSANRTSRSPSRRMFVGRAVAALAADPDRRARWNGASLSSGGLAQVYGFDDADGSRLDCWRNLVEVMGAGKPADTTGYR